MVASRLGSIAELLAMLLRYRKVYPLTRATFIGVQSYEKSNSCYIIDSLCINRHCLCIKMKL